MSELAIGQRIGHIRVDSVIGAGGMGEVYLGFDEKLQRNVALKTIRGHHRMEPAARARFLREARILSKLDHPGICRIYDLIEHQDCDFLVLEYIDGSTLTEVMRAGNVKPERALAIAESVARALASAHAESITHRDLKPDNVMITRDGSVKILDFGLSRSLLPGELVGDHAVLGTAAGEHAAIELERETNTHVIPALPPADSGRATAGLTENGSVLGTVRYMSPEQARGEAVGEAADLYSFGVILQELFTGESAYPADISWRELLFVVQRGEVLPPIGIDPEITALIAELTSLEPGARPRAVEAAERIVAVRERPIRRRQRRIRIALATIATAAVATSVVLTWLAARGPLKLDSQPTGRIALLPFVDRTGKQEWVRAGLRDLVAKQLVSRPTAALVSLEHTEEFLRANKVDPKDEIGEESATAFQSTLGASVIIQTLIDQDRDEFLLTYRLSVGGRTVERQLRGAALPVLGQRLAMMLAEELKLGSLRVDSRDPFASQAYGIGLHIQRTQGAKAAKPLFESCLVLDPEFQHARLRLAQCEEQLGNWQAGVELANNALAAAEKANDQIAASSALTFLGSIASARGDYETAKSHLERSLAVQRQRGDQGAQAVVLFQLGRLAYSKGAWNEASDLLQQALELDQKTGDHPGAVDTTNYLGLVELGRQNNDRAVQLFTQARSLAEGYGDRRRRAHALVNLGNVANSKKDQKRAEELWREALAELRACGDRRNELVVLNNLGVLLLDREDGAGARATYHEVLELAGTVGDAIAEAAARLNLAHALLLLKDTVEARRQLERVMALETWVRDDAETFSVRAELASQVGKPDEAVKLMEEAKKRIGNEWDKEDQAILDRYRRAARVRRRSL
jgi:serine/threonine protein kinase/tetratricopeptide (TPR) repeat protein